MTQLFQIQKTNYQIFIILSCQAEGVDYMDFLDQIKQFAKRVETLKDSIQTEEATKTSIILPFFSMLGYDVFNPLEFVPEFVADVGIKKGERVDYAIIKDNEPMVLIEVKATNKNLERHDSQLFRYFGTTKAKFAILTNGIIYRFYTDIDERNKMDKEPFLEFNILKIKDGHIQELKKFKKDLFDINTLLDTAGLLKYEKQFKSLFAQQLQEPTDDFVKIFISSVYSGQKNQSVLDRFRPILKKSLNDYINETLNEKIMLALENSDIPKEESTDDTAYTKSAVSDDELEAFFIVKTILRDSVDMEDLYYKKTESYFAVLYQNNVRKWICRFVFSDAQKTLFLPQENKRQTDKYIIQNITDIMDYKNNIIAILSRYLPDNIQKSQPYRVCILPRPIRQKRSKPNKYLRSFT